MFVPFFIFYFFLLVRDDGGGGGVGGGRRDVGGLGGCGCVFVCIGREEGEKMCLCRFVGKE